MPSALDERTFETAVEQTPEEKQATLAHFREKGLDAEIDFEEGEGQPAEPEKQKPDSSQPDDKTPPAQPESTPPQSAPAAAEPASEPVDAESQAEFHAVKNDGEKLGKWARKNKEIRELKSSVSERDNKLAEKDGRIAELQRQLAEKSAVPAAPLVSPPQAPEPVKEEPIKPQEFSEPKPTLPKLADFADQDDPVAALEEARNEWLLKTDDWRERKREFDRSEKERVQNLEKERDSKRNTEVERNERISQRLEAARKDHPDFDAKTQAANFGPLKSTTNQIMQYLLVEDMEDGLNLAYELATNHPDELEQIIKNIGTPKTNQEVASAINRATQDLAVFRYKIQASKPADPPPAPAAESVPPKTAAPPNPAPQSPPQQTPPVNPPRREEPSPAPARGRSGGPTTRIDDIDPMDSDARREAKKRAGLM